jgi:hypothetical protein
MVEDNFLYHPPFRALQKVAPFKRSKHLKSTSRKNLENGEKAFMLGCFWWEAHLKQECMEHSAQSVLDPK